jgi:hypothetical protein
MQNVEHIQTTSRNLFRETVQNVPASKNVSQFFQIPKPLKTTVPGCRIHLLNPWPPWRRLAFAPPSEVSQLPRGIHGLRRQPWEGPQLPGAPQPQLLLELLAELETLRLEMAAGVVPTMEMD